MSRSTFSVLFYANKSKVKDGIVSVMGRITINRTQSQFSCKRSIPLLLWDAKGNCAKGRTREALDLNRDLDNIKAQIIKHYQHLSDREAFVTAEMVRNAYQGFGSEYETLLGAFDKDIANLKRRVGKDRALGTYKLQVRSRNYVADFLQMIQKKDLVRIKAKTKKEELKNSATKTATAALNGINSLLGGNKVNRLEKENKELRNEVEDLNMQIERLHADMQKAKDNYTREMNRANEQHQQEVSNLRRLLDKAYLWFPSFKRFLNMERECLDCGFNMEQTDKLLHGQTINYSGWLHSNEYRRNALANNVTAQVIRDEKRKLFLHINQTPITQWFKEQFGIGQEHLMGIRR